MSSRRLFIVTALGVIAVFAVTIVAILNPVGGS